MKKSKTLIDMTDHGPIEDICPSGYQDCTSALTQCIKEIVDPERSYNYNDVIFEVLVTDIKYYSRSGPERVDLSKTKTFRQLKNIRKKTYGEQFSLESLADKIQKHDREMEALHRQGQARAGRSLYTQHVSMQNAIKEEEKFQDSIKNEPSDKQRVLKEKREKENRAKGGMMYIG